MTRIRFSVRTMLVAVAIVAIPLGWLAVRLKVGRDKQHTIAELREMGVSIVMAGYQDASPMIPSSVRPLLGWQSVGTALGVSTDEALSKLDGMQNLHTLGVDDGVSDSGLKSLRSLKTIERLMLSSSSVTDEGLRHVSDIVDLKELDLSGTKTTGAGLLHLKNMTSLEKLTFDGPHAEVVRLYVEQGRGIVDALVASGQLRHHDDEPSALWLEGKQVTDELIEFLVPMPKLESITLKSTAVTKAGLKRLADMPQLKSIALHGDGVLRKLPAMPHIESLHVSDTAITANQLAQYLSSLPQLMSLRLEYTAFSDDDLKAIVGAQSLQELSLGATKIEGAGLRHLAALKKLRHLHLGGSTISDDGLRHLSQLRGLRDLSLEYTSISDAGIPHLKELKALRRLVLLHTNVTQASIDELKVANPDCVVITR